MRNLPSPTVRLRLTLLYGGLFLLSGAVLLGINYVLVARATRPPDTVCVRLGEPSGPGEALDLASPAGVPLPSTHPTAERCPDGVGPPDRALDELLAAARRRAVEAAPDGELGVVINGRSPIDFLREERERNLRRTLTQSGLALAAMALGSVGLGWYLAGRALRPLHEITAAAKRISIDDLHQRIALDGPDDELQELADTFDAMLARLEAALVSQRRFVADASHELRTPLAVMRTELEVTLADEKADAAELRRMAGTVRDALARSEQLVGSLLVLARSERDVALDDEVDLGEVAAGVAAAAGAEAEAAAMTVETELWPAPARGDRALLERLVANLVENGIRHGRPGGAVEVHTATRGGVAVLTVTNDGPDVDASERERMFEPFVRLGTERTGSRGVGLGLAIVRAVATAHGATVTATPRRTGGLEVTVAFPPATPGSAPASSSR